MKALKWREEPVRLRHIESGSIIANIHRALMLLRGHDTNSDQRMWLSTVMLPSIPDDVIKHNAA